MGWFIFALLFFILVIVGAYLSVSFGKKRKAAEEKHAESGRGYDSDTASGYRFGALISRIVAGIFAVLGILFIFFATVVSNGVGEAKVYTNPDGTIAFTQTNPGWQVKAPWQDYADFDLFSQEVLYAGGDTAPSYSGGQVNGKEVTVSVGGVNGGSTQANLDISVTYSIDAESVEGIYREFKSQERFTKQVIEKTILSTIRTVPGQYTAVEFRGDKRGEASDTILDRLNSKFTDLGVEVNFVNLQDVRYPENVETALADVEAANQQAAKAEAQQRQAEVEAETKRITAQGDADAIAIRNSQAPNDAILKQMLIEAYGAGTVFVVPEGSQPLVTTK